jgi:hypothetical protein
MQPLKGQSWKDWQRRGAFGLPDLHSSKNPELSCGPGTALDACQPLSACDAKIPKACMVPESPVSPFPYPTTSWRPFSLCPSPCPVPPGYSSVSPSCMGSLTSGPGCKAKALWHLDQQQQAAECKAGAKDEPHGCGSAGSSRQGGGGQQALLSTSLTWGQCPCPSPPGAGQG